MAMVMTAPADQGARAGNNAAADSATAGMRALPVGGDAAPASLAAGASATSPSSNASSAGAAGAAGQAADTPRAGSSGAGQSQEPVVLSLLDHAWFSGPMLGYDMQYMDRPFELGPGPFSEVTLRFQLESPCFPFDKWSQSPPPDGEAFPAQCDRFDRLMYFEIDPAQDAADAPGAQVLRAITPYGGPLEKRADITDFVNAHLGQHSLRSFLGTWVDDAGEVSGSDGGYFLSVEIAAQPGAAPRRVLAALPLWSGWVGVDTMLPELPFTLPEGTARAELVYLVTGHGGAMDPSSACIGAAEEFCKRTHHLYVDEAELTPAGFSSAGFVPWRDDCSELCTPAQGHPMMGSYCRENPNRAARSVTAPRANWCPGDAVAPIVAQLPAASLSAGAHRARFAIADIYPEGRWQVALVLYAYGD